LGYLKAVTKEERRTGLLKWILKKRDVRVWSIFTQIRIAFSGAILCPQVPQKALNAFTS
jgi:hypothetical protein